MIARLFATLRPFRRRLADMPAILAALPPSRLRRTLRRLHAGAVRRGEPLTVEDVGWIRKVFEV